MTLIEALCLGVVQGLTEFLPVSSSGHLVLAEHLLGIETKGTGVAFEVIVHLGTLVAVLIVFREEILRLLKSSPKFLQPKRWALHWVADADFRTAVFVVVGTLPVVIVGLFFKDQIRALFGDVAFVPKMLLVTAVLLAATAFAKKTKGGPLTFQRVFLMGLAQAMAILPGISRSGSTISVGILAGTERERAGSFSFLLSIPAILGATVLELGDFKLAHIGLGPALVAFFAAFVSGWIALVFLMKLVRRGQLWYFAPYLLIAGLIGLFTL